MAKIHTLPQNTYNDYPESAIKSALKVIKMIDKGTLKKADLSRVALIRAKQIANKKPIVKEIVKRIASRKPMDEATNNHLAWGGNAMIKWAKDKLNG